MKTPAKITRERAVEFADIMGLTGAMRAQYIKYMTTSRCEVKGLGRNAEYMAFTVSQAREIARQSRKNT